MNSLLLALIIAGVPDTHARLAKELDKQLKRSEVELRDESDRLAIVVTDNAFERVDPLWKILFTVVEESRRKDAPLLRVELVPHKDNRICLQREELVRGYLFKKQRGEPARIELRGLCALGGAAVPGEP